MKRIGFLLIFLGALMSVFQPARAQSDQPLVLVMTADGPIMPPMLEYIQRGIETANQANAEVLIIQLNTPGGSIEPCWRSSPRFAQRRARGGLCCTDEMPSPGARAQ
jgi:membrane-bound ClpP family serine protease